jgi:CRISPR-associated endonuclease/helicase Cas3
VQAANHVLTQEQDEQQQQVFATIVRCWLAQIPVRITHRKLHGQPRNYVVHPWQIEPAVWGDGNYLLGYSEYHGKLATFKLARIEKATESVGLFKPAPENFNIHDLLNFAWGIWHADEEPVTVKLRFNKWAVPRLKESIWHPQARLFPPDEDGNCIWEVQVAEWREMEWWVKGWGSDVMVLAPDELKLALTNEARRLARQYQVVELPSPQPKTAIAHTKNADGQRHSLIKHLQQVARLAAEFATPFGAGDLAYRLGLWHDVGKFNPAFQQYLLDAESEPRRKRRGPDHKAAGARIATEQKLAFLNLLIQGHHGGLQTIPEYNQWYADKKADTDAAIAVARQALPELFEDISLQLPDYAMKNPHAGEFFLRFLFSVLVDADFLDTEEHFNPKRLATRKTAVSIETLWQRFARNQQQLDVKANESQVNRVRRELYTTALAAAMHPPGLFRLSVPTGGGKTRLGLAFALRHALEHGLRRVIVAVPFITITEQTASVYRQILESPADGDPVVLEHHSGAVEEDTRSDAHEPSNDWNRLAAENWDAPVVVTTTVQLFESLFANGTGRCRKLHRLAQSVIILDEAQSLPVSLLAPILDALRELCAHYGSTVILSTATQPAFEVISAFQGLKATEIIPQPERYFRQLSRVTYSWRLDPKPTWREVATWMRGEHQVLTILNTKKDALALLDALDDPKALHLSTLLCGAHRRRVVAEVKRRLAAGEPCRLVTTQVVEAGVDLDFPVVMRAFGPLDSIIQAAGRANREGLLPEKGRVIVFDPAEGGLPRGNYSLAKATTQTFLHEGPPDMDDPASIARYFKLFYPLTNPDQPGIQALRKKLDYPAVARSFRMIDDHTMSVVVPYGEHRDEIADLVRRLESNPPNRRSILRQLQPYLVSLYRHQAQQYLSQGFITPILTDEEGTILVGQWPEHHYDDVRGLTTEVSPDQLVF